VIHRRVILTGLASIPLVGCASQPKTPLAHLHGQEWVRGAYEQYAKSYAKVEESTEKQSFDAYRVLARKGIVALDGLQSRDVPFFVRADGKAEKFVLERNVPERLTYSADMSEADRGAAKVGFEKAREHLHTDYEEIRRLDGALTTLLGQLKRVRLSIDEGKIEGYRIVRQLAPLAEGQAPFELPYQVSLKDYEAVLHLLLTGLEEDSARLAGIESDIVTVGLIARSTDANSGSLSANLRKVLLAVAKDADTDKPREATYPGDSRREAALKHGRDLAASIGQSEAYKAWEKSERAKQFEAVGSLLATLDMVTGLPTSALFQQAMDIWRGDADYLSYVKTLVKLVPGGGALARTIGEGVEKTEKARDALATVRDAKPEDLASAAKKKGVGLLNTGSSYAVTRAKKQLVFFSDGREAAEIEEALKSSTLG
jgi:hypothetical protein